MVTMVTTTKLQIALEYMVLFAFVMLIFTIIFVTVAKQRASILNEQLDSNIQLVSEDIAGAMSTAAQAGNGYNSTLQIPSSGSISAYSVNITRSGEVIASSKIGAQLISSVSFSLAGSVVSNSAWANALTFNAYSIPVANSTLYIRNTYGTLCIDYSCPNVTGQAGSVALSAQPVHAAVFVPNNGVASAGSVSIPAALTYSASPSNSMTLSLWIDVLNFSTSNEIYILNKGSATTSDDNYAVGLSGNYLGDNAQGKITVYAGAGGAWGAISPVYTVPTNGLGTWYDLVFTYSSSSGGTLYVDGVSQGSPTAYAGGLDYSPPANIVLQNSASSGTFALADVQVYDTALTAYEAEELYQEGITGAPLPGDQIGGWWPLNGNANDYSGNMGSSTVSGYVPYLTAVQLYARVKSRGGLPLQGALVGFQSSLGNFSAGGRGYANYTNSTGVARAILTQSTQPGYAAVSATAFEGNLSSQSALVGWWPLNLGQGASAPDASGRNETGRMTGVSWSQPALETGFGGVQSYVLATENSVAPVTATLSAWVYDTQGSVASQPVATDYIAESGGASLYLQGSYACISFNGVNSGFPSGGECASSPLTKDDWYLVSGSYSSSTENVFIDGAVANTLSISGTLHGAPDSVVSIGVCASCATPSNFFSGYIANVQGYANALTGSEAAALYQGGIGSAPLWSLTSTGWWPLDGDANDYSGTGQNGTAFNAYAYPFNLTSFPNATYGSSEMARFSGSGSYIDLSNSSALKPSSAVSIVAWVNASAIQAVTHPGLVSDSGTSGLYGYNLSLDSGVPVFTVKQVGESLLCSASGTTSILDSRAHFVSAVYNGNSVSVYLDGVLQKSSDCQAPSSASISYSTPNSNGLIGSSFNGLISNVQIYSSALTQQNMTGLYLQGEDAFPVGLTALAGWYPLDGSAVDSSLNGDNGNATGVTYAAQNAVVQGLTDSLLGYGSSFYTPVSHITVSASPALYVKPQNTGMTVSAWFYLYSLQSANEYILQTGGSGSCPAVAGYSLYFTSSTAVELSDGCGDGAAAQYSFGAKKWYDLVVTITSSAQGAEETYYVNGAQVSQSASAAWVSGSSWNSLYVGGTTPSFNGELADLELYDAALNASQAFQLYKGGPPAYAESEVPVSWST